MSVVQNQINVEKEVKIDIIEDENNKIKTNKSTYSTEDKMRILGEFLVSIFLCVAGLLFIGGFLYFFIKFIVY